MYVESRWYSKVGVAMAVEAKRLRIYHDDSILRMIARVDTSPHNPIYLALPFLVLTR